MYALAMAFRCLWMIITLNFTTFVVLSETRLPVLAQSSTSAQSRRSECAPRPHGYGPIPEVDNTEAFYNYQAFQNTALDAPTPENWTRVFVNRLASSKAAEYLSYAELKSYDTQDCATRCDQISECEAINIYFERTPTLALGYNCPTSPSMTVIKCVFWGKKLRLEDATNWGQRDWSFDIVIAGSNGYNRGLPTQESAATGMIKRFLQYDSMVYATLVLAIRTGMWL